MNQLAQHHAAPTRATDLPVPAAMPVPASIPPSAHLPGELATRRATPSPLAPWRLRRVTEFVETHLDEKMSLTDVAAASGLSRMHFAALFRASTGLRPSEYVQRQRIERAQAKLVNSNLPVVDIALSVGFQSQAHFSTVFKRIVGDTPLSWRRRQLG